MASKMPRIKALQEFYDFYLDSFKTKLGKKLEGTKKADVLYIG